MANSNHLLYQWKDEFYRLYPDANILIAEKTDFTKQNRERLFGRIATGNWDAVIVAHSSFKKIDMPHDVQQEIFQEQVDAVADAIEAAKEANGSRSTIKQLEKQKEKMGNRLNALLAAVGKKDKSVDFSDLGKDQLLSGVKEVTRNSSAKVEFGKYRGFEVFVERTGFFSGTDGFRLCIKGADGHEFRPANLAYSFDDKLSLTGLFQRMDNFLAKGLDEWVGSQRKKASEERGELETVMAAMGKEFPQKEELALVRENHAAVIRELQRMQEDDNYVSTWEPKKLEQSAPAASETASSSPEPQTLIYQDERGQTEYTASRQFNGYEMEAPFYAKLSAMNMWAPSAKAFMRTANGIPQQTSLLM